MMNKKEFQVAREAVRQREDKRLRNYGYTPELLPAALPTGALAALQWALDEARAWRGSYTGDQPALDAFNAKVDRATAALKAARKQNAAVQELHRMLRAEAQGRMLADETRSRKSAGLEK